MTIRLTSGKISVPIAGTLIFCASNVRAGRYGHAGPAVRLAQLRAGHLRFGMVNTVCVSWWKFMLIPVAALILFLPFPYFCSLSFSSFTLIPHSLLFPIFPQSRPASSGFTPVSVLHPYPRIRSY